MTSEIKENEIDTSNEKVTHLEFVGDRHQITTMNYPSLVRILPFWNIFRVGM